jgi:hypothetical protein
MLFASLRFLFAGVQVRHTGILQEKHFFFESLALQLDLSQTLEASILVRLLFLPMLTLADLALCLVVAFSKHSLQGQSASSSS